VIGRVRGEVAVRFRRRLPLGVAAIALTIGHPVDGVAEEPLPPDRPSQNLYGVTGLIDMPSAEMQPDGQVSFTAGYFGGQLRNTIAVQALPWLEGAFRYSLLDEFSGDETLYDRSLDFKLRLVEEGTGWPAIAFGVQDFLGTGVYSGEYLVASKSFLDRNLTLTGGMGWGRFAGTNGIENPFCTARESLCTRNDSTDTGGSVNFGNFFSGEELGFFGGLAWRTPVEGLVLKAEYSDDDYNREKASGRFSPNMPLNFGLEYQPVEGVEIGAYYMYGAEFGARLTLSGNPFAPLVDFDDEPAPRPIRPRPEADANVASIDLGDVRPKVMAGPATVGLADAGIEDVVIETRENGIRWAEATLPASAAGTCPEAAAAAVDAEHGLVDVVTFRERNGRVVCTVALQLAGQQAVHQQVRRGAIYPTDWYLDPAQRQAIVDQLTAALGADRIGLLGIDLTETSVSVYVENRKFRATPRAIGRTARVLAETMPPSIESFEIVPVENSLPVVSVTINRSALEGQVGRPDAARASWLTASVQDAAPRDWSTLDGTLEQFPRTYWAVNPAVPVSFFDPDQPIRADLSVLVSGGIEFLPGLSANAEVSKRIMGNLDDIERESDSVLPHVRSDIARYLKEGDPGIQQLTLDYVTKLDSDVYGRVSAGLLEGMYGGVSGEVLWQPAAQNWGLGLELNWVQQRDFDQLFGFRDYSVATGHASLYIDTDWHGVSAQIDAGRYLAGDWGGTFSLKRRFSNGWELGAFATFTDVSFDDYGEGSFDKGIILTIPFDWTVPFETRSELSTVIKPLTRDGGQRLNVANRLYPTIEYQGRQELRDHWPGFWK